MSVDPRSLPEGALLYCVVHDDLGLVAADPSVDVAIEAARSVAGDSGWVLDSAPPGNEVGDQRVAANPRSFGVAKAIGEAPRASLRATGLTPLKKSDVMAYGVDEALKEWSHLMPSTRRIQGADVEIKAWDQPDVAAGYLRRGGGLLRDNFKLSKREGPGAMSYVLGLSLLPAASLARGYLGEDPRRRLPLATKTPKLHKTFCSHSTKECRSSCLVFSGQNTNTDYHVAVKQGAAMALLQHPAAFMRVLVEACANHLNCGGRYFPYVRLNTLSDIPWELFTPWLFSMFPGKPYKRSAKPHAFYDYTKVPGRKTPANYDLTFSYAGTESNHAAAEWELNRGTRVAVVFLLAGRPKSRKVTPLPKKWLGRKVIDGDSYDTRPRDPGGVIVGLRYKSTRSTTEAEIQAGALPDFVVRLPNPPAITTFIVRARVVDGQLVVDETPRQTGVVPLL